VRPAYRRDVNQTRETASFVCNCSKNSYDIDFMPCGMADQTLRTVSGFLRASVAGVCTFLALVCRIGLLRMVPLLRATVVCAQIRRPAALLWLGGEQDVKRHLRPLAEVAFGFDVAAVRLDYGLGD